MFKKGKKSVGVVTVIEDDVEANRAALFGSGGSRENEDEFADLGLSPARGVGGGRQGGQDRSVEEMTVEELEDLALKEAMKGKSGTRRALQKVREAREIGLDTAEKLQGQTKQLEKMGEDIEVVHDYLDKGERLIEKLSKPKLVRMFVRGKGKGKGLDKAKGSKKDRLKREELRQEGLDGLDLEKMRGGENEGNVSMAELEREELLRGGSRGGSKADTGMRGWLGKKTEGRPREIRAAAIVEDYSEYSAGVAQVMQQQDQDLDEMSEVLGDIKGLTEAMNKEITYQNELVDQVNEFATETAVRTKNNVRKVNRLLK